MTLAPEMLAARAWSRRRTIAATALIAATATTAVFIAGVLSGATLASRAMSRAPACPDQAVAQAATAAVVPAVAILDWSARLSTGPLASDLAWATSLYDLSSQYTATSWSGEQVLGPPDVYPRAADDAAAWASLSADGGREFIEVGFGAATAIDAVHVAENLNPGAVRRVEGIAADGRTVVLYDAMVDAGARTTPTSGSALRVFAGPCTPMTIARIRVSLDSQRVAGWNELDAIGVHRCAR